MRALVLTTVLLLAVCWAAGPSAEVAPGAAAKAKPRATARVMMRHNRFGPHRIVVHVGQTVRWANRDSVAHTVASADLHLSSDAIRAGKSFSYRPRRRGRFAYYCTIHAGQTGVLVVR
jgi:plastocyanin